MILLHGIKAKGLPKKKCLVSGQSGFTLLEVMVALGVFAVGILGIAAMHMSSIQGNDFAIEHTEALALAYSTIDGLMALPIGNVVDDQSVDNNNTVTWTVTASTDIDGDGVADIKQVRVTVQDAGGNTMATLDFSKTAF